MDCVLCLCDCTYQHFLCGHQFLWVKSVSWLSWVFNQKVFCCIILFSEGTSTLGTHIFYILKLFISIWWCLWVKWKKIREGERPFIWQRLGWRKDLSDHTKVLFTWCLLPWSLLCCSSRSPKHHQRHKILCSDLLLFYSVILNDGVYKNISVLCLSAELLQHYWRYS